MLRARRVSQCDMERYAVTIILLATSTLSIKTYRSDYVYNRKADAFYKFHTESEFNREAQNVCQAEGGSLVVPSSHLDLAQVHAMLKQFPDLGEEVWVGNDGLKHEPSEYEIILHYANSKDIINEGDTLSSCEVVTRKGDIETTHCFRRLPFVCKVDAKNAPYDSRCGVFARGYEYYENVGNCYKIPEVAYSWNQAYDECDAHGAHLVVLNSELEHQVVWNLTRSSRTIWIAVTRGISEWFFFAGLRAEKPFDNSPRLFKTIFGQTLKEAGFDQWSENEPNNALGREYCGSIFRRDGKYNDVDCTYTYGFICEKEQSHSKNKYNL